MTLIADDGNCSWNKPTYLIDEDSPIIGNLGEFVSCYHGSKCCRGNNRKFFFSISICRLHDSVFIVTNLRERVWLRSGQRSLCSSSHMTTRVYYFLITRLHSKVWWLWGEKTDLQRSKQREKMWCAIAGLKKKNSIKNKFLKKKGREFIEERCPIVLKMSVNPKE